MKDYIKIGYAMNVNKILMVAAVQLLWMIPSMATDQSEESSRSIERCYNFSKYDKECDQKLFFVITSKEAGTVSLIDPYFYCSELESSPYSGRLNVPSFVKHEGVEWRVTGLIGFEHSSITHAYIPSTISYMLNPFNRSALEDVVFENNINYITGFNECPKLDKLELPEKLDTIRNAFNDISIHRLRIPVSTEYIDYSFSKCDYLKYLDIPTTRYIVSSFCMCPLLESIKISNTVKGISDSFNDCERLRIIELPFREVKLENAFNQCPAVSEIIVRATEPYPFPESCFKDIDFSTCTLSVPKGCRERYRNAEGWNKFGIIAERCSLKKPRRPY